MSAWGIFATLFVVVAPIVASDSSVCAAGSCDHMSVLQAKVDKHEARDHSQTSAPKPDRRFCPPSKCVPGSNLESERYCGPGGSALNTEQPEPEMQCALTNNDYTLDTSTFNQQVLSSHDQSCIDFNPIAETDAVPNCIGPLEKLIGTWQGEFGFNVVAVPQVDPTPQSTTTQDVPISSQPFATTADKVSLNQNYTETLQFWPIPGNVKNRGYAFGNQVNPACQQNQNIQGILYALQIFELDANGSVGGLIHAESGQWLYNTVPGNDRNWEITRIGVIPHGAVPLALGNWTSGSSTAQLVEEQDAMDLSIKNFPGGCLPAGWNIPVFANNTKARFNDALLEQTRGVKVTSFDRLDVSTRGLGRLEQLPFIRQQAHEKMQFGATFWVQSVEGEDGKTYDRLQYAQRTELDFTQRFDCRKCEFGERDPVTGCYGVDAAFCSASDVKLTNASDSPNNPSCAEFPRIAWPHIQVNTLKKVSGPSPWLKPQPAWAKSGMME